jgi:hypothetical protein
MTAYVNAMADWNNTVESNFVRINATKLSDQAQSD